MSYGAPKMSFKQDGIQIDNKKSSEESGTSTLFETCPLPLTDFGHILMGHGSGGQMTSDLMRHVFLPAFNNEVLGRLEDQATLPFNTRGLNSLRLAFTTDSYVVQPIFFPGGDIGKLAVHGTINDLAVGGAQPLFLSAAFILEEGLDIADLKRITASMREACDEAGVTLVTGDTKVVDRGKGDQIFITTSGIGVTSSHSSLSISNAQVGDHILISGTMGDHGITIMSVREGIEFETTLKSDTAPLNSLTRMMLEICPTIRCMRDPTRGGVAGTLNELASASRVGVKIQEQALPIKPEVKGACEMLGLDPLYVANEGKLIAVVPPESSAKLLTAMRQHPLGIDSSIIGEIVDKHVGMVILTSPLGGQRVVTLLTGEQLPRIC